MVFSVFGIGFLSFLVWAHHMYLTGMGEAVSSFFSIHHHCHLSAVSDYLERSVLIALARFDSVPCADAVRHRFDANVRHRGLNRHPVGVASG